jgi:DNA-binding NarL/FixJ family response regulator
MFTLDAANMIRLIIADDHPVIIDGIKTILDYHDNIQLMATVNDGLQLLDTIVKNHPDLILMDINMPGMNGIEATKKIKKEYPDIKVLAFSQYKEKRFVKQILKSGANGYLLKSSAADELIKAIHMVMDGGVYLSSDLPNIFEEKPKKRSDYLFPELTNRELDVLRCIGEEKNTQEIADELFISPHTVESHRSNLLLKVGTKNTAGLVKWAVENEII